VAFRIRVSRALNFLLIFSCQSLVVYASQALHCVQVGTDLVLVQDTDTVRFSS